MHPVCVHWLWAPESWLARVSRCRPLDFAGGTVVHMIGGAFGLVGAALVGPRLGRFEGQGAARAVKEMPGHDMGWVTIGTLALWFGWYGFNTGSVYLYAAPSPLAAQRAAMNTTLGASGSGLVALLLGSWLGGTYDLRLCCNGVLSGLVTVTAMCGFVDPYAAAVGGAIAGACYIGFSRLMVRRMGDGCWGVAAGVLRGVSGRVRGGFRHWSVAHRTSHTPSVPRYSPLSLLPHKRVTRNPTQTHTAALRHRRPARLWRGALWQRPLGDAHARVFRQAVARRGADRRRGLRRALLRGAAHGRLAARHAAAW